MIIICTDYFSNEHLITATMRTTIIIIVNVYKMKIKGL